MQEFVDFLGAQPPFDALSSEDLTRLAGRLRVTYATAGTVLVEEGGPPLDHLWMVRTGSVEVVDRGRPVDVLVEGEVFGHISLLSGLPPQLQVRAAEDTICYQIPDPRTVLEHPEDLRFTHVRRIEGRERMVRPGGFGPAQAQIGRFIRPVVWASPTDTVRVVARRVTEAGASCAVVDTGAGLGIATDRDFRARVATGELDPGRPVAELLSVPVVSVARSATVADALLAMVEAGVHHLVVVDDRGAPVGVVRAIDLGSVDVRDPLLLRTAIAGSESVEQLGRACALILPTVIELADGGVPPLRVAGLATAIVESVLVRLLQLVPPAPLEAVPTSWLLLGSLARREPLPASDVDTAVVWSAGTPDGSAGTPDGSDGSTTRAEEAYAIRHHASAVLDQLRAVGLSPCPDGANADNPLFSRSREEWVARAARWIAEPTAQGALLLCSIVADSRPLTEVALGRAITDTIAVATQSLAFRESALRFATASRPPVGFLREFVVEHGGEHRGGVDLKRGGLLPVTALARWTALVLGDTSGGTVERIGRAADAGLLTGGEADDLCGAYEDIFALAFGRELGAVRHARPPSTWLTPRDLEPLERRHLRESFRAVSAVQSSVVGQWRPRLGI